MMFGFTDRRDPGGNRATTNRRDACATTDRRDACATTNRRDACTTAPFTYSWPRLDSEFSANCLYLQNSNDVINQYNGFYLGTTNSIWFRSSAIPIT